MRRSQRGSGLIEIVWLSILLLLPLLWVVTSVFTVQRGSFGVSAAARAAARAYALAPNDLIGSQRAQAVAEQAMADQGLEDAAVQVTITCTPYPRNCHSGTSVITVRVRSSVSLPALPDVFGLGSPTFGLSAEQRVPIGRYREVSSEGGP